MTVSERSKHFPKFDGKDIFVPRTSNFPLKSIAVHPIQAFGHHVSIHSIRQLCSSKTLTRWMDDIGKFMRVRSCISWWTRHEEVVCTICAAYGFSNDMCTMRIQKVNGCVAYTAPARCVDAELPWLGFGSNTGIFWYCMSKDGYYF